MRRQLPLPEEIGTDRGYRRVRQIYCRDAEGKDDA